MPALPVIKAVLTERGRAFWLPPATEHKKKKKQSVWLYLASLTCFPGRNPGDQNNEGRGMNCFKA